MNFAEICYQFVAELLWSRSHYMVQSHKSFRHLKFLKRQTAHSINKMNMQKRETKTKLRQNWNKTREKNHTFSTIEIIMWESFKYLDYPVNGQKLAVCLSIRNEFWFFVYDEYEVPTDSSVIWSLCIFREQTNVATLGMLDFIFELFNKISFDQNQNLTRTDPNESDLCISQNQLSKGSWAICCIFFNFVFLFLLCLSLMEWTLCVSFFSLLYHLFTQFHIANKLCGLAFIFVCFEFVNVVGNVCVCCVHTFRTLVKSKIINKNYIGPKNVWVCVCVLARMCVRVCARYFVQRKLKTKKAWHFK